MRSQSASPFQASGKGSGERENICFESVPTSGKYPYRARLSLVSFPYALPDHLPQPISDSGENTERMKGGTHKSNEVCPDPLAPTNKKFSLTGSAVAVIEGIISSSSRLSLFIFLRKIVSKSALLFLPLLFTASSSSSRPCSSRDDPSAVNGRRREFLVVEDRLKRRGVAARRKLRRVEGRFCCVCSVGLGDDD